MVGERAQLAFKAPARPVGRAWNSEFQAEGRRRTTRAPPVRPWKRQCEADPEDGFDREYGQVENATESPPLPEQPSGAHGHEGHCTEQQQKYDEGFAGRDTGRPRAAVHLEQAVEAGELTASQEVDRDGHGGQSRTRGRRPRSRSPRPARYSLRGGPAGRAFVVGAWLSSTAFSR